MLSLILILKQQFIKYINGKYQINEHKKSHILFFKWPDQYRNFNSILLKIDKKSCKDIDVYYTGYITIKDIGNYESIYSVNPLYFMLVK